MLTDCALFWFETEVIFFGLRFWLVEYCVFWNGERQIVEMVELTGGLNGYLEE